MLPLLRFRYGAFASSKTETTAAIRTMDGRLHVAMKKETLSWWLCFVMLGICVLLARGCIAKAAERQWDGFGPQDYNFMPVSYDNSDPAHSLLLCWVMMQSDVQWTCSAHSCSHSTSKYTTTYTSGLVGSTYYVWNSKGNKVFWGQANNGWFSYTKGYSPYFDGYQGFCGIENGVLIAGWSYCPSGQNCFPQ